MSFAPKPREESLIERAAKVYDFGAHLRGREGVVATTPSTIEPESMPVRPEPFDFAQESLVEGLPSSSIEKQSSGSTSSARTGLVQDVPQSVALAAAEWAVPVGVASIDRIMLAEKGMLVPGAPVGALAEEFRLVKRQLLLTARTVSQGPLGQRARTILVGSGKPGEGKTFCAINLALSLSAEKDVEILLVDADFAKPDIMKSLGLDDSIGLLEILDDPTIDPEACIVRTDVPQLSLLPAGQRTHADTELLASDRTGEILDRLLAASPKRIIVFDTPPALAASPASVLALLVGQVMLVVRADRTTESDVREAVALLDGCEQISLVLNSVSYEPGRGRFGSYYGQENDS